MGMHWTVLLVLFVGLSEASAFIAPAHSVMGFARRSASNVVGDFEVRERGGENRDGLFEKSDDVSLVVTHVCLTRLVM